MCGIFGIINRQGLFEQQEVVRALDSIKHRGPDDSGIELSRIGDNWDCWLGQRRLSILDLSPGGHQPMVREVPGGTRKLVFNGEIYNHDTLRRKLASQWTFISRSDTEVLLAGLHLHRENFLEDINGMMAFAFYDSSRNSILLGRDRLGKKPLYIYQSEGTLAFSSELKAFVTLGLKLTLNEEALAYYRWLGYVPAELSIYNECSKLPAGSFIEYDLSGSEIKVSAKDIFWDPLSSCGKVYTGSYANAVEDFINLLDDATDIRLEADVPVGVFLSGGIDSSLVAASVARKPSRGVAAYTVKFNQLEFDESDIAANSANQLGIQLNKLYLGDTDFDKQLKLVSTHFDEPFSDSSQIPTMAISEAASQHVKVVLTGDGGDEVFLGYPRFSHQAKLMRILNLIKSVPFLDKSLIHFFGSGAGRATLSQLLKLTGSGSPTNDIRSKAKRVGSLLSLSDTNYIYETVMCTNQREWLDSKTHSLLPRQSLQEKIKEWYSSYSWGNLEGRSVEEKIAALDLITYLRDDVLVKVDRSTMAYGLEARSPLLDYRIVEFGNSLPRSYKMKNGIHKSLLRDALSARLSGEVLSLGKRGFGVPLPEKILPPGPSLPSRWNQHIESQWRLQEGWQ